MSKFLVNGFNPTTGEYISGDFYNRVDAAIHEWFYLNQKYPTCISINVRNYYDANKLIEWSSSHKDKIVEWHEKYNCTYSLTWLLDELIKKFENKFTDKDFHAPDGLEDVYSDQVYPFCLG